jgi:YegS/Rv2252/BmrU family lipid kinase
LAESSKENPQFERTTFILNPRSGNLVGKRNIIRIIDEVWGNAGRDYSILITTRRSEGIQLARKQADDGCNLIVAIGGDGTLNEVVKGVLGTETCVGLIPSGSGNGFARHWRVPLNPETAVKGLLNPRIKPSDIGKANHYLFLVTFGCGYDAYLSRSYAASTFRGMPSYFYHGVRIHKDYKAAEIKVHVGDHIQYSGHPFLLTVSNTKGYGGGTIIAPEAKADDGLLDLCTIEDWPVKMTLHNLYQLFVGDARIIPTYRHSQFSEAVIERSEPGPIHIDGDPFQADEEIEISVIPNAIRFALPT